MLPRLTRGRLRSAASRLRSKVGRRSHFASPRTLVRPGFPASLTSAWTGTGENESEYFGWWLSAGDVDGDGFDDLIVGAPHHDYVDGDTGRVVVFEGSSVGLSGPAWQATGDLQAHLGHMVGAADVNGDGYSDLVVTDDPLFDGDGSAYAYLGSHSGLDGPPRHRRPPRAPRVR